MIGCCCCGGDGDDFAVADGDVGGDGDDGCYLWAIRCRLICRSDWSLWRETLTRLRFFAPIFRTNKNTLINYFVEVILI